MSYLQNIYEQKDKLWFVIWLLGIAALGIWDMLFLNQPAFRQLRIGFYQTIKIALIVILLTAVVSWIVAVLLERLENSRFSALYLAATFVLNIIRSIPQIVGILGGYTLITFWLQNGTLRTPLSVIFAIAVTISLFVFLELVDLIRERIHYYKKRDFYNAMRVCGISENRIINTEILWKNSLSHIFNKLISIFGITIFLQCSIDFIISVGLSTRVSAINLPVTLGSLLAKIDSKQDILAIGHTFGDITYFSRLFFEHLQGISVAFLIVFTLLCVYKISNGFAERYEL